MPRLENWVLLQDSAQIRGEVWNDEKGRFKDGELITTSRLNVLDVVQGVAVTQNTRYELGKRASY